jgi:hypothetical protein
MDACDSLSLDENQAGETALPAQIRQLRFVCALFRPTDAIRICQPGRNEVCSAVPEEGALAFPAKQRRMWK